MYTLFTFTDLHLKYSISTIFTTNHILLLWSQGEKHIGKKTFWTESCMAESILHI